MSEGGALALAGRRRSRGGGPGRSVPFPDLALTFSLRIPPPRRDAKEGELRARIRAPTTAKKVFPPFVSGAGGGRSVPFTFAFSLSLRSDPVREGGGAMRRDARGNGKAM
ncbi:hypothetical protein AKJ65_02865 [candidate division MSBL1 archaeon SCGC-AAA259E19]|uniref:Uncharacterized protein n=1 Tax=candidate division MSBL1 archaeon SCGC-AAA259E19 TaxID=1698264 RepID=A0A133ULL4_9EURY|nr:hypothetical protein AKJ65_02865 [candidate division MSBL1 archaeon SCGC-AAA259E19]